MKDEDHIKELIGGVAGYAVLLDHLLAYRLENGTYIVLYQDENKIEHEITSSDPLVIAKEFVKLRHNFKLGFDYEVEPDTNSI